MADGFLDDVSGRQKADGDKLSPPLGGGRAKERPILQN
jgi:hypothetical protein